MNPADLDAPLWLPALLFAAAATPAAVLTAHWLLRRHEARLLRAVEGGEQ